MAVVRSRGEVPSWLDQEWSRSQVPRTVAGLTRALEVCCRTSFDKEELSDVARALDLSMPVASRARGRGKQALRLGASMALHLGCCDLSTRSRLEAFSVALGTADLPTSTGDT